MTSASWSLDPLDYQAHLIIHPDSSQIVHGEHEVMGSNPIPFRPTFYMEYI